MTARALRMGCTLWAVVLAFTFADRVDAEPSAVTAGLPPQTVLRPGLYLLQTRTREGSCDDAERTGYVTSAVATLDGVPGSREMTLKVVNSQYWPTWKLVVAADGAITGHAVMGGGKDESAGVSRFEIRAKKGRFQGVGSRSYPSKRSASGTCTLHYDALLKPLG